MSDNGAKQQRDLSVTIPLIVPIEHGGETLFELTLNEPDLGGLMELDKAQGDFDQVLKTLVACTGLPPSVIRQLKARDLKACGEAAAKIMGEELSLTGAKLPRGSRSHSIGSRVNLRN